MSLKLKAFQSLKWNSFASVFTVILGFVQLYILVRYLDKSDFGTMALGLLVLYYLSSISDLGMNNALIHKQDITKVQRSTVYFLVLVFSVILCFSLNILNDQIAGFFENGSLSKVLKFLSITLIFDAIGNLFNIYHQKELNFKLLSSINIAGAICTFLLAIFLATQNFQFMALVYAYVLTSFLKNAAYCISGWKRFPLTHLIDLNSIKYFLNFGTYEMAHKIFGNFVRRIDTFIIGKYIGINALGSYDVIKNILRKPQSLIVPVLTDVSFPLLSKVQESSKHVSDIYIKQLSVIYFLISPVYAFFIFNANLFIKWYFGEEWLTHSYLFILICTYFLIRISGTPVGGLLRSIGKIEQLFWWNIITGIISIILLFTLIDGSVITVVKILLLIQLTLIGPNYYFNIKKHLDVSTVKYFGSFLLPIVLAMCSFGIVSLISFNNLIPILQILCSLCLGAFIYLGVSYRLQQDVIIELKHFFKSKLKTS